jgi:hypothetical protein
MFDMDQPPGGRDARHVQLRIAPIDGHAALRFFELALGVAGGQAGLGAHVVPDHAQGLKRAELEGLVAVGPVLAVATVPLLGMGQLDTQAEVRRRRCGI